MFVVCKFDSGISPADISFMDIKDWTKKSFASFFKSAAILASYCLSPIRRTNPPIVSGQFFQSVQLPIFRSCWSYHTLICAIYHRGPTAEVISAVSIPFLFIQRDPKDLPDDVPGMLLFLYVQLFQKRKLTMHSFYLRNTFREFHLLCPSEWSD